MPAKKLPVLLSAMCWSSLRKAWTVDRTKDYSKFGKLPSPHVLGIDIAALVREDKLEFEDYLGILDMFEPKDIKSLDLLSVGKIDPQLISVFKNLESLCIRGENIGHMDDIIAILEIFPQLKVLCLQDIRITDEILLLIGTNLKHLTHLRIDDEREPVFNYGNKMTDDRGLTADSRVTEQGVFAFAHEIAGNNYYEMLVIKGVFLQVTWSAVLCILQSCPNLKEVQCEYADTEIKTIDVDGMEIFTNITRFCIHPATDLSKILLHFPNLEFIKMFVKPDWEDNSFERLNELTNLCELDIWFDFDDFKYKDPFKILRVVGARIKKLKLNISGELSADYSREYVAVLGPQLEELNLDIWQIGNISTDQMPALTNLGTLKLNVWCVDEPESIWPFLEYFLSSPKLFEVKFRAGDKMDIGRFFTIGDLRRLVKLGLNPCESTAKASDVISLIADPDAALQVLEVADCGLLNESDKSSIEAYIRNHNLDLEFSVKTCSHCWGLNMLHMRDYFYYD